MAKAIKVGRRRFLGAAGMTLAAGELGIGSAVAATGATNAARPNAPKRSAHTSFASLKQIDAGLFDIGYGRWAEQWPCSGTRARLAV